jgi:uncharacterized protein (TIGR03000 family)
MEAVAQLIIKAPTDVRILVNGKLTQRPAAEMTFRTPALQRGKAFRYEVQATASRQGQQVSQTKTVTVRAGELTQVDFTDLKSAQSALVTVNLPADARIAQAPRQNKAQPTRHDLLVGMHRR